MKNRGYGLLKATLIAMSFAACSPAFAQRVIVFGDSLSDTGNIAALTGGLQPNSPLDRYSNGTNWIDQLYGPTTAFYATGQTTGNVDFAVGGAFAGSDNLSPFIPIGVQQEIDAFRATIGQFAPTDTVTLWAGANNGFAALGAPGASQASISAGAISAATDVVSDVTQIAGLGGRRIIVLNLPDLGSTPAGINSGGSQAGLLYSFTFNSALSTGLAQVAAAAPGVNIIQADVFSAFNVVAANPAAFGFTNFTGACLFRGGAACNGLAFADGYVPDQSVHPTEALYAYLAQYINLLSDPAPSLLLAARLADTGVYENEVVTNKVFDRLSSFISGTYANKNGPFAEAFGNYANFEASNGEPSYQLGFGGFRGGVDQKNGSTLTGASISLLGGSLDTGSIRSNLISARGDVYGTALFGNAYISGDAGIASLWLRDIARDTGFPTVTARGNTEGYVATAAAEAGYVYQAGPLTIIPSARVTYFHTGINGYNETAPILALSYGGRDLDSVLLGGKVRGVTPVGSLFGGETTAFGEIGYENFVYADSGTITTTFVGNTALPTIVNPANPNGPGIIGKVGLSNHISENVYLDVQYGISAHDEGGTSHSGDVRMKATF